MSKVVYMIGDRANADVLTLINALIAVGIQTTPVLEHDEPDAILLCLTDSALEPRVHDLIYKGIKIWPVLFAGGALPSIMSDIAYANFAKDPRRCVETLKRAIEHFYQT